MATCAFPSSNELYKASDAIADVRTASPTSRDLACEGSKNDTFSGAIVVLTLREVPHLRGVVQSRCSLQRTSSARKDNSWPRSHPLHRIYHR